MIYDPKQLKADLLIISEMLGELRQHGFYNRKVYEGTNFKIVNYFVNETVVLSTKNESHMMTYIDMSDPLAEQIMFLAMRAEDVRIGWLSR